ncbi:anthrone oxygenase family protein [Elioraea rosea]|uniref:anthrone oxygenase family protein n=1 Tax=Elioraea rosea TaxID=2492390 RepID=UPI001950912B
MTALRAIPPAAGMGAMRSINRVILRSAFMPLFFGTPLAALLLLLLGIVGLWGARSWPVMLGAVVHLAGMTGVTAAFNVPLNTRLDGAGENIARAEAKWLHYLSAWTRWNHLRTISSITASALFVVERVRSG